MGKKTHQRVHVVGLTYHQCFSPKSRGNATDIHLQLQIISNVVGVVIFAEHVSLSVELDYVLGL